MSNSASAGRLIARDRRRRLEAQQAGGGRRAGAWSARSADRGSAIAPSARIACTLTPSGCRSSPASASIAGREAASFSSPSPLIAKPRVMDATADQPDAQRRQRLGIADPLQREGQRPPVARRVAVSGEHGRAQRGHVAEADHARRHPGAPLRSAPPAGSAARSGSTPVRAPALRCVSTIRAMRAGTGLGRLTDEAERLGGAALHPRIGIGQRAWSAPRRPRRRRSGRSRTPPSPAPRARRRWPARPGQRLGAGGQARPGPTPSAARRRTAPSASVSSATSEVTAGGGAGASSITRRSSSRRIAAIFCSKVARGGSSGAGGGLGVLAQPAQIRAVSAACHHPLPGMRLRIGGSVSGFHGLAVERDVTQGGVGDPLRHDRDADAGAGRHGDGAIGRHLDARLDQVGHVVALAGGDVARAA